MSRQIIVHIGLMKTGSSSIQGFLQSHRDALQDAGVFIPDKGNHFDLIHLHDHTGKVNSDYTLSGLSHDQAQQRARHWFNRQIKEWQASRAPRLVLSSEALSRLRPNILKSLDDELRGLAEDVRYIAYVRHPWSAFESMYRQRIKSGRVTFQDIENKPDMTLYNPAGRLLSLAKVLGRERMDLRVFDRTVLTGGDVVEDFLTALDLTQFVSLAQQQVEHNTSPSLEALYLSDLLTQDFPMPRGATRQSKRAQYPQVTFSKIPGRTLKPLDSSVSYARASVEKDLKIYQEKLSVFFPARNEPQTAPSFAAQHPEQWDEVSFRELAHLLNAQTKEIEDLRKELTRHRSAEPLLGRLMRRFRLN